jgi:hypothetical protein
MEKGEAPNPPPTGGQVWWEEEIVQAPSPRSRGAVWERRSPDRPPTAPSPRSHGAVWERRSPDRPPTAPSPRSRGDSAENFKTALSKSKNGVHKSSILRAPASAR